MTSDAQVRAQRAEQLEVVLAGYDANSAPLTSLKGVNPYYYSSDHWLLWEAGHWLQRTGQARPRKAKKSRGYTVKIAGSSEGVWTTLTLRDDGSKTICNFTLS